MLVLEEQLLLKDKFLNELNSVNNEQELNELKVKFLGKKGEITLLTKDIANLSIEEKKTIGSKINELKDFISNKISEKNEIIIQSEINKKIESEFLDITLPPRECYNGGMHPLSKVQHELEEIFDSMGFSITDGPEVEDDWHCFTGPNTPEDHPARQMQDTFYLPDFENSKIVLRTQTTSMQIREMEKSVPPFKFITIGKTFRSEMDATHTPMFHQIEGVYVNKNVTMQDLKNCLITFLKKFFGLNEVSLRFRPSYFPFTSPSLEIDIKCTKANGKLILGTGNDWMEICGAGMIHPNVLKNVNIDPTKWQGFAFGFGVERLAMLKYGIRDMRNLYEGDMRFLKNYNFKIKDC